MELSIQLNPMLQYGADGTTGIECTIFCYIMIPCVYSENVIKGVSISQIHAYRKGPRNINIRDGCFSQTNKQTA